MANIRTSGVFSLGSLGNDGAVTAPWTPADITSANVVGWFDGENVNGGTSGNSGATSWVNQISGQNDLSFTQSPTVGTDNVRTISGSYLVETGTASFQQTANWRVFVAATIKGGSTSQSGAAYYPLVSHVAGTIDTGGYIFWKGGTSFASYPNYNNNGAWGNFDNHTPGYSKTFQNNPGVYDFTASTTSPWTVSFDGGRDIKSGPATYTTQIGAGRPIVFGYAHALSRRLDAEYYQIVIVQGTLNAADEEKLYGYLAHKAGSQSDLPGPGTNAYQSTAPTKTVAGATRPTRRWGGITGRSLVATQPAVEATLPSSPEIGIFRGDLTQGSTTPTPTGTPTTGGTGINSYFQTTASAYYTFTPAAASSWTLVWSADHTNQTFAFIATMNGQGLQIWNTASGGLKVYNGSTWVADSMAGLSFGDRYYFALKYDGTTLKSYRWDGASAMSALPTASSNTAAYSINTSTAYIAQYSSPSSGLDHAENMYAWAYYGSSLSDANLIDVFNTIGGFNDSAAGANTLPTTGVLSLAEDYQSKL